METLIKEETKDPNLSLESSGDNLASLSLFEKYDRYLQQDTDVDSDGDFFPDDDLKEKYAQLRSEAKKLGDEESKNHRLSTGLPARYKNIDQTLSVVDDESRNGHESEEQASDVKSGLTSLNELIEKLESIRSCGEEGNSIFCTETELEAIQERYGEILDFMHEKASTFEPANSCKDLTTTSQPDDQYKEINENNKPDKSVDQQLLEAKIESVRQARDKFYEVEQQVREQLEQLELVERYKMESVG